MISGCTSIWCTGILFDGRIITRKTRKSHRNTENKKNLLSVCCTSPAPTPNPRKSTEFTKRGRGWSYERISAVIEKLLVFLDVLRFGVMDGYGLVTSIKIGSILNDKIHNTSISLKEKALLSSARSQVCRLALWLASLACSQTFGLVASLSTWSQTFCLLGWGRHYVAARLSWGRLLCIQPALAKGEPIGSPRPCPLFVNSVDFRGFRVGAGEDYLQEPLNWLFLFSVFLCDFRVFRVMIRPSKRIPVHQIEVHPEIQTKME